MQDGPINGNYYKWKISFYAPNILYMKKDYLMLK